VAPALAALAGTFASPRGVAVLSQLRSVSGSSTGLITEWHHLSLSSPGQLAMLGAGLLAAAVAFRRGRWDLAGALAVLVAGGAYVIRLLPVLDAVAAAVLAATLIGPPREVPGRLRGHLASAGRPPWSTPRAWAASHGALLRIGAAAAVAALAAQAAAGLPHIGRTVYPLGSVAALPSGCRLFNSYALGGIVILLRPGVPVSLDSRNDLYGRRDVLAQQRILDGHSGGPAAVGRLGVTCALIPAGSGLARQLERSPAWRRLTRDRAGSAFALRRHGGVPGGPAPRGDANEGR
jgi:hypothetical protein